MRAIVACLFLASVAARPAQADGMPAIELGLRYTGEVIADVAGGVERGAGYEGLLHVDLDADLGRLARWDGTRLHASLYQIHGHGPSANYVGNIMDVSNIEARPSTRLYALWLEKSLPAARASLRAGQLGADEEFLISPTASALINGSFAWAALTAADQTNGGPAYPLATPGVRLRIAPERDDAFLLAAFAGNPAGSRCEASPQRCDPYGTTFSVSGGTLWMSELQLAGAYKLGAWYETGSFADQGSGALEHRDDWGLYAIADRALWHGHAARSLRAFLRAGAAPADRNLISSYVDAGLGYAGAFSGRPRDVLTLGVAYAKVSGEARDYESVIELSYVARLARWCSLQPDLQYVIHPGGNAPDPNDPSRPIPDALVVGLRATFRL